jgi:hypothetical protein
VLHQVRLYELGKRDGIQYIPTPYLPTKVPTSKGRYNPGARTLLHMVSTKVILGIGKVGRYRVREARRVATASDGSVKKLE